MKVIIESNDGKIKGNFDTYETAINYLKMRETGMPLPIYYGIFEGDTIIRNHENQLAILNRREDAEAFRNAHYIARNDFADLTIKEVRF